METPVKLKLKTKHRHKEVIIIKVEGENGTTVFLLCTSPSNHDRHHFECVKIAWLHVEDITEIMRVDS